MKRNTAALAGHASPGRPAPPAGGWLHTSVVQLYLRACAAYGLPRQRVLRETGLSEQDIAPTDGWVRQAIVERLFRHRLALQPAPIPGLQLVAQFDPSRANVGMLGFLCLSSPSIRHFFDALVRFGQLATNLFELHLRHRPGATLWCVQMAYEDPQLISDNEEWLLASLALMIQRMNSQALREVHLAHPPRTLDGAPHPLYQQVFPAPVRFNQPCSALLLNPQTLNTPSTTGDALVFDTLCQQAEMSLTANGPPQHLLDRVRHEIHALLASGRVSREDVCQRIGVSGRHLHRLLKVHGSTYQALLDEIRGTLVVQQLSQTPADIQQLARMLAFSDGKAFSRWFRLRFGMTVAGYLRERVQVGGVLE